jgi:hypothetical protein
MGGAAGSSSVEVQTLIPYINSFEASLDENRKLLETLEGRVELLAESVEEDAGELPGRVQKMGDAFSELFGAFKSLESAYERAQTVASRSGRMIESLQRLKRRSLDAKELFSIFLELAGGRNSAKLDAILDSAASETRLHGAKLMRRLRMLGEAEIEGAETATKLIGEIAARYEEGLLAEFHGAFEQNNMDGMKMAASILVKYNGGQSCVQSFVAQHSFFVEPPTSTSIKSRLHPSRTPVVLDLSQPPQPDEVLVALYEQIARTAEADWSYLEAVFTEPVTVMNYLMQRIFRETVQLYLDEILRQASAHSQLAYLRTLYASYQATKTLVGRIGHSYSKHVRDAAIRASKKKTIGSSVDVDEVMAGVDEQLQSLVTDLFMQYIQHETYTEQERKVASDLFMQAVAPLQAFVQARRAASRNVISSVFGRSGANSPVPITPATTSESATKFVFAGGESLFGGSNGKVLGDDGIPSEEVVRHCLALHAEWAARLFVLLPMDIRGNELGESLRLLLSHLLDRYVEASLDCALSWESESSSNVDPRPFVIIQSACRILSLLLTYCRTHFLPLIVTASSIAYRNMVQFKTDAAARMTEKIDRLMRKEVNNALKRIEETFLAKQKKADYKPKPDDLEALVGPSQVR